MAEYTKGELDKLIDEIKSAIIDMDNFDFDDELWNQKLMPVQQKYDQIPQIWEKLSINDQMENIEGIIDTFKGVNNVLIEVLSKTKEEVQKERIKTILDKLKDRIIGKEEEVGGNYIELYDFIWSKMCPDAKKEIENRMISCDYEEIKEFLPTISPSLQNNIFSEVIDKFKDDNKKVLNIWNSVNVNLKEEKFDDIMDKLKDNDFFVRTNVEQVKFRFSKRKFI